VRPVDQTLFGFPGGNCFAACVATLLELPLDDVPNFCNLPGDWEAAFNVWLRPRGLYALTVGMTGGWRPAGLHIMAGASPRGLKPTDLHAVVARADEILHDPHPSRAGLLTRTETTLLVPLDPFGAAARVFINGKGHEP
jgi:hypothetical protein